jgi:hypothetical protein
VKLETGFLPCLSILTEQFGFNKTTLGNSNIPSRLGESFASEVENSIVDTAIFVEVKIESLSSGNIGDDGI